MRDVNTAAKITISTLHRKKRQGKKIAMLTAYDYPTALLQDQAGIDIVFVGDSVGPNILGYDSEQQVTMADMLHHAKAVRRGVERAFFLVDMPFMSYQPSIETALYNAGRLVQEAGAEGIKLEGAAPVLPQIKAIVAAGIPVMAHIGHMPQSKPMGAMARVRGRGLKEARQLLEEALRLEDAGAFAVLLELVTEEVAQTISQRLQIPTIGIGAGRHTDGQVLVVTDVLGLTGLDFRLSKAYGAAGRDLRCQFADYRREVEEGHFPAEENVWQMEPKKAQQWRRESDPNQPEAR